MALKETKNAAQAKSRKNLESFTVVLPTRETRFRYFPFLNEKIAMVIIGIIGFTFYITSINGEYALDDGIIIHQNDHVIKGVRGIKDILTKDAYESFYRRMCATDQLAGGRYRPLSVVSFALEQEFIGPYRTGLYMKVEDSNRNGVLDKDPVNYITPCGRPETNYEYNDFVDKNQNGIAEGNECYPCWDLNKNFQNDFNEDLNVDGIFNEVDCQVYGAKVRHFNNIWTYALGCMFLYLVFARYIFRTLPDLAFISALLFTMHPIHSEAIANVKSRDEIFSLIFISLTLLYTFKYLEFKRTRDLFWASLLFLLALLSKEYAVMLLILIPVAVYVFTINNFDVKEFFVYIVSPSSWLKNKQYSPILFVGFTFALSAFFMLYIKRDFDVHALPGAKPIRSFWLFPILYVLVGLFILGGNKTHGFHRLMSWFYLIMLVYLGMRLVAVKLKPGVPDTEILNNPYLLANGEERFATKGYVLLKYLTLQLFPHPLSSDYSYNTIHYRHFFSWDFLLSIGIHLAMVFYAVKLTLKKHVLGFALMTYIVFALMIGNVLMDIGATMGERLIFHSNIGFCIALGFFILFLFERFFSKKSETNEFHYAHWMPRTGMYATLLGVGVLFGMKTWERNWDWKNDVTLFLKDVKTMPHSVLVLGNAGARWVDLADTKEVTGKNVPGQDSTRFNDYNGTLKITDADILEFNTKDRFITQALIGKTTRNIGQLNELYQAIEDAKQALAQSGAPTTESYKTALKTLNQLKDKLGDLKRTAALNKGIKFLKHAIELHPRYVNGYLNLGLASFKLKNDYDALFYWKYNAERLYPNNPYLRSYYQVYEIELRNRGALAAQRGRWDSAAIAYNKWTLLMPQNSDAWTSLSGAYFNQAKFALSLKSAQEAVKFNPGNAEAKRIIGMISPQMLGIVTQPTQVPAVASKSR